MTGFAFQDDQTLAIVYDGKNLTRKIIFWDITSNHTVGERLILENAYPGVYNCLEFNPEKSVLAICNGPEITLWDIETNTTINTGMESDDVVSFSPDGRYLVSRGNYNEDYGIIVWDMQSSTNSTLFKRDFVDLTFNPADGALVYSRGSTVYFWDIAGNKKVGRSLYERGITPAGLNISPDGTLLVMGWDYGKSPISIWDLTTCTIVAQIEGNYPLLFSPDGNYLSAILYDPPRIVVWRVIVR
jgi:WD40 repeat protein